MQRRSTFATAIDACRALMPLDVEIAIEIAAALTPLLLEQARWHAPRGKRDLRRLLGN
jgi:hypothetical protein